MRGGWCVRARTLRLLWMLDQATIAVSENMKNIYKISRVYTEEQAARLARVSLSQMRYWDGTEFFTPSIAYEDRRVAFSRIYSFEDVVALRVLGELRNFHDVPLQHLRRVRDKFKLPQSAWSDEEIYVHRKRVYFKNERGNFVNSDTDEETLPEIPIPRVMAEVEEEAKKLDNRPMEALATKVRKSNVARKAEVFKGTRIPIDTVQEYFKEGLGIEDVLKDYPTLTYSDVDAAIRWLGISAA